jgi:hypothetical protein
VAFGVPHTFRVGVQCHSPMDQVVASDMARAGRPKAELVLTDQEREQLLSWSRRARSAQTIALHSRIVLTCAEDAPNIGTDARSVTSELT